MNKKEWKPFLEFLKLFFQGRANFSLSIRINIYKFLLVPIFFESTELFETKKIKYVILKNKPVSSISKLFFSFIFY